MVIGHFMEAWLLDILLKNGNFIAESLTLTHSGIMAGKLKGVMPAVTPRGTR